MLLKNKGNTIESFKFTIHFVWMLIRRWAYYNIMIVPSSDNLYSDESEDGAVEIDIYVRKYQLLLERSEVLQQVSDEISLFKWLQTSHLRFEF